jgi:hypothetical protein
MASNAAARVMFRRDFCRSEFATPLSTWDQIEVHSPQEACDPGKQSTVDGLDGDGTQQEQEGADPAILKYLNRGARTSIHKIRGVFTEK